VRYRPVDFAAVARGFGVPAYVATDDRELARAWSESGRGPRLIDARVDPAGYRHVIRVTRG
jgi:acetolactate synthase I/II/III large subunit